MTFQIEVYLLHRTFSMKNQFAKTRPSATAMRQLKKHLVEKRTFSPSPSLFDRKDAYAGVDNSE